MSALFIYYTTGYMFFLYTLSNEKKKNSEQGNRYKLTLATARITTTNTCRLTTDPVRMKWWNESQEEAEPSTPQLVPDLRWHNYVRVTVLSVLLDMQQRSPKASGFHKCGVSAAGLISLQVCGFFFFLQSRRGKFFTLPLFTAGLQIRESGK